jgi:ABC-type polysaccharide/polyol phosphate transport system ATPase subunit
VRDVLLEASDVWKKFRVYRQRAAMLKEALISTFRGGDKYEEFWALKGVSLSVKRGEAVGVIGRNGAGKSTLFKVICGVLRCDKGRVNVKGRIAPLIELEAGFHPELTGLENIYLNGAIYGMKKKEMQRKLTDIIEFSGLAKFVHSPIRTYSSGMHARLGFSLAINVDADILLVDEVLAVGDAEFQTKCYEKIREMRGGDVTIVYISHDFKSVVDICDRALWLDQGELKMDGEPEEVVRCYLDSNG